MGDLGTLLGTLWRHGVLWPVLLALLGISTAVLRFTLMHGSIVEFSLVLGLVTVLLASVAVAIWSPAVGVPAAAKAVVSGIFSLPAVYVLGVVVVLTIYDILNVVGTRHRGGGDPG